MFTHDVIDESVDRPRTHVAGRIVVLRGRQRVERPTHLVGIGFGAPACIDERPLSAAAEVDAELLEHTRRPEIRGDNLSDRLAVTPLAHIDSPSSVPSVSSVAVLGIGRYDRRHMLDDVLRRTIMFRRLSADDRQRVAAVASLHEYGKGDFLFHEGDESDDLYVVVNGRVKVFKTTARGTDVILELFGPGDPVGAVAVYESRAYPASAVALEPTSCLLIPRKGFFSLLEAYPTMVRGLLVGMTHRLVELTN